MPKGLLAESWSAFRDNAGRLVLLGVIGQLFVIATFYLPEIYAASPQGGDETEFRGGQVLSRIALYSIYAFLIGPLIHGVMALTVLNYFTGKRLTTGDCIWSVVKRLPAIVGALLLFMVAAIGLMVTIIGIPFAFYFIICWSFYVQVALLSGLGPVDILKRSRELVRDQWGRVFLVGIAVGAVTLVLVLLFQFGFKFGVVGNQPLGSLFTSGVVTSLLMIVIQTVFYLILRTERESLAPEKLQQEIDSLVSAG